MSQISLISLKHSHSPYSPLPLSNNNPTDKDTSPAPTPISSKLAELLQRNRNPLLPNSPQSKDHPPNSPVPNDPASHLSPDEAKKVEEDIQTINQRLECPLTDEAIQQLEDGLAQLEASLKQQGLPGLTDTQIYNYVWSAAQLYDNYTYYNKYYGDPGGSSRGVYHPAWPNSALDVLNQSWLQDFEQASQLKPNSDPNQLLPLDPLEKNEIDCLAKSQYPEDPQKREQYANVLGQIAQEIKTARFQKGEPFSLNIHDLSGIAADVAAKTDREPDWLNNPAQIKDAAAYALQNDQGRMKFFDLPPGS